MYRSMSTLFDMYAESCTCGNKFCRTCNPPTAERAKREAVARVEANANSEWKRRVDSVIRELAAQRHEFTTDDVWERLSDYQESTHERRALGSMMTKAARDGVIVATERYVPSTRRESHANPKRVWRGCL